MENTELQSTFELIDNIEFEEKVDIEDLVLPSEPTDILKAETKEIKEEPLEQSNNNTMPIHAIKSDISNMETIDIKEEPLEQISNNMSIHEIKRIKFDPGNRDKKKVFQSDMENEIIKLFDEFDMKNLPGYDQVRLRKLRQLVEKYQTITQEVVFKLHEKTLEVKTNELEKTKEELQMARSTNLTLSKRIQELQMAKNQVSGQKDNSKPGLKSFDKQEVLVNSQEPCNVNIHPVESVQVSEQQVQVSEPKVPKVKDVLTSFHIAAQDGNLETCEAFINRVTDINTRDKDFEKKVKVLSCDSCDYNSKIKSNFKRHMATCKHRGEKRKLDAPSPQKEEKVAKFTIVILPNKKKGKNKEFVCDYCDHKCFYKCNMEQHVKSVHEGIKPKESEACQICHKTFSDAQGLRRHAGVHQVEKNEQLECDICKRKYNGKNSLSQHKRDAHGGTHDCPQCLKTFKKKSNLTTHLKTRSHEGKGKLYLQNRRIQRKVKEI